jgi:hypothetical protein
LLDPSVFLAMARKEMWTNGQEMAIRYVFLLPSFFPLWWLNSFF